MVFLRRRRTEDGPDLLFIPSDQLIDLRLIRGHRRCRMRPFRMNRSRHGRRHRRLDDRGRLIGALIGLSPMGATGKPPGKQQ